MCRQKSWPKRLTGMTLLAGVLVLLYDHLALEAGCDPTINLRAFSESLLAPTEMSEQTNELVHFVSDKSTAPTVETAATHAELLPERFVHAVIN